MAEEPTNPTGQTGGDAGNDVAPSASATPPHSQKSTSSPAADAALEAARAAISQLGNLNNLVNEDSQAATKPVFDEAEFAAQMAAAREAEKTAKPIPPGASPLQLPNVSGDLSASQVHALDLLGDVHLNVKIELGRTRMLVEDLLRLSEGAVVELDKLAGDPVDVYVNERHVARGEVLVLNDNFCVRINEVLTTSAGAANEKGAA